MLSRASLLIPIAIVIAGICLSAPQKTELEWVEGTFVGHLEYTDEEGVKQEIEVHLDGTRQLGRFVQVDLGYHGKDGEENPGDVYRITFAKQKESDKYRGWFFDTDEAAEDPIYEIDDSFIKIEAEAIEWGSDEDRTRLVKDGSDVRFTIEDKLDGAWVKSSDVLLKKE